MRKTERGFYFRLCREQFKGLTVREMLSRLESDEITEWMAWTELNDEAAEKRAKDTKR